MGYSGRYHAASLAAVFLALAIGILIGVGLGHNVIPAAQQDLEQSLKSDLSDARGRADTLQGQLNQERDFSQQVFPSLVGGQPRVRFRGAMLSRISGRPGGIDGVIVVRSQPTDMNQEQSAATGALEAGILAGLERTGRTPVAGVERSDSDTSSIGYFDSQ